MDSRITSLIHASQMQDITQRKETMQNIFEDFIKSVREYMGEGRITAALQILNTGVEIIPDSGEWNPFRVQLQKRIVLLIFEINLGIALEENDIVSPLSMIAVATSVESSKMQHVSQKPCSLDADEYKRVLKHVDKMRELASKAPESNVEIMRLYIIACLRSAIVLIGSNFEESSALVKSCMALAETLDDPMLLGSCSFTLALVECKGLQKPESDKNKLDSVFASFRKALVAFHNEGEYALVVRVELAKVYYDQTLFYECIDVLLNCTNVEVQILASDDPDTAYHWAVLESLLQKSYLEACKTDPNLRDAYRCLLQNPENLSPPQLLLRLSDLSKK